MTRIAGHGPVTFRESYYVHRDTFLVRGDCDGYGATVRDVETSQLARQRARGVILRRLRRFFRARDRA